MLGWLQWYGLMPLSLGYPDLSGKGEVWAPSGANRLTSECRNLTAGLCCLILGRVQQLLSAFFGVMFPPSIKIVRKLVELTEQYRLIMHRGYCQHSRKCHKKVKLLPRPSFSILYGRNKKEKENERLGTRY